MTQFLPTQLPPIGGWNITGQQPAVRQVPGVARPVDGYVVNFITGYGTTGSVFIPVAQYGADTVKAAIGATVAQLDAVNALTHETT